MNALPIFLAAAESKSFAAAGRRLDLSPSAAGKAIARLEGRLGVTLFHRTTRRVSLTAEGELLFERARRIGEDWQEALALLARATAEPRGRLRVALPAIGYRLLARHLADFAVQYPCVALDLDLDDRIVDLVAGRIDVAIRSGPLGDSTHRSRRLGTYNFVLCAAPSYLAARGAPAAAEALRTHAQVRFRHPDLERLQAWRLVSSADTVSAHPAFVSTSMEGVLTAAQAGLGIAQMPDFLAEQALATGALVAVLPEENVSDTFWLVWPHSKHHSPKLRAFLTFSIGRLLA